MSDDAAGDRLFGDRVAKVLRTQEQFTDDFEDTLVAAIRADRPLRSKIVKRGPVLSPSWWRTPRTLRFSPLSVAAYAASLAGIAALVTLTTVPPRVSPALATAVIPPKADTVTLVRFVFVGQANTVSLVGDFNRWGVDATPMIASGANGAWTASVPVPQGRHEYAFIVDGKRWVPDPFAPAASDEFDTRSSVITVGT